MEQRTEAWHKARNCMITASRFGDVIANCESKRYQLYLTELIANLEGAPFLPDDDKPWFRHGKELEPIARARYEFEKFGMGIDEDVQETGFFTHPTLPFVGGSPDGVLGNRLVEIKSSISHKNFLKLAKNGLPSVYKPQVQGELWICGFEVLDLVLFFRDPDGMLDDEIKIVDVFADAKYHKLLEEKCCEFWEKANKLKNK